MMLKFLFYSRDPAQLLITFNARINAQDSKGNTPLHYCVAFNNAAVMQVLLDKGASLDIRNNKGQTALDFAIDRRKMNAANLIRTYSDQDKESLPVFLHCLSKNKVKHFLNFKIVSI
jgi:ankyrin repeat protein